MLEETFHSLAPRVVSFTLATFPNPYPSIDSNFCKETVAGDARKVASSGAKKCSNRRSSCNHSKFSESIIVTLKGILRCQISHNLKIKDLILAGIFKTGIHRTIAVD